MSFRIRFVSSIASFEQSLTNFRLQFVSLRNDYTSLTFLGTSYSSIKVVFSGLILILLVPIIKLRKLTSFLKNSYFSGVVLKVVVLSRSSIAATSLAYYSRNPFVKISILSIQAITVMLIRLLRTLLIILQYVASALVSPISITKNSQSPFRVRNAILYSSPSFILIIKKASRRSILEYYQTPQKQSFIRSISSIRQRSFLVISFRSRQSITFRRFPPFLGIKNTSAANSNLEGRIRILPSIFVVYSLSASRSTIESGYISR